MSMVESFWVCSGALFDKLKTILDLGNHELPTCSHGVVVSHGFHNVSDVNIGSDLINVESAI